MRKKKKKKEDVKNRKRRKTNEKHMGSISRTVWIINTESMPLIHTAQSLNSYKMFILHHLGFKFTTVATTMLSYP